MPRLAAFLHYRVIDVSSFKEVLKRWYPDQFESFSKPKAGKHRALEDIKESIEELVNYRKHYISEPK